MPIETLSEIRKSQKLLPHRRLCRQRGLLRYDVGVDANNYAPVSLTHILAFFEGVQPSGRMKWQDWIEPLR